MSEISLIFQAAGISKSIVEYLNFVESTNTKIDKLGKAKFDAAKDSLKAALSAGNIENQKEFVKDARRLFSEAIKLEATDRLAFSYVGLAVCYHYLGEDKLCEQKLRELLDKDFIGSPLYFTYGFFGKSGLRFVCGFLGMNDKVEEIENVYKLKEGAKKYLKEFGNPNLD